MKNFKRPQWRPSWISEWNDFSISECLCHSDASHQVSAQSDIRFWRRCRLKNFKMVALAFSNSESSCCHNAPHLVSAQSNLWFWRRGRKCEKRRRRWGGGGGWEVKALLRPANFSPRVSMLLLIRRIRTENTQICLRSLVRFFV